MWEVIVAISIYRFDEKKEVKETIKKYMKKK
jgi:hypothetical protein